MRAVATAVIIVLAAGPALAQASCAPASTDASILASPDWFDLHPDWSDGSTIGLGWSLVPTGDAEGADGDWFLQGDLYDADGGLAAEGVYVGDMEWECDVTD